MLGSSMEVQDMQELRKAAVTPNRYLQRAGAVVPCRLATLRIRRQTTRPYRVRDAGAGRRYRPTSRVRIATSARPKPATTIAAIT